MSQKKVDRYKDQKRNREKLQKKEKREWMLTKLGMSLVALALVVWVGASAVSMINGTDGSVANLETFTVNTTALDEYMYGLETEAE